MTPTSQERNIRRARKPAATTADTVTTATASRGGGTQLYDAIYLASDELMKPKDGRKALVVFSDGVDRGSKETLNDAIDAADHAGVQVFTIYFKGEEERSGNGFPGGGHQGVAAIPAAAATPAAEGLARRRRRRHHPGGTTRRSVDGKKIMQRDCLAHRRMFFEAKKKDNLDDIYGLVAGALRQQYLLTYTPDKVETEGDFHKIVLKTDKPDLTVITREGYYATTGNQAGGD